MKLSDLSREESDAIIKQRIAQTKTLHELAKQPNADFIYREAANLDLIARAAGVYVEFEDDLDDNDL